jgi:hypothetical protein
MGWSISHAAYGETIYRSALQLDNLARQLAHVMPGRDWRAVRGVFDQAQKADGPFTVSWADAGRIADALNLAVTHPLMPSDWGELTGQIAAAADRAAKDREPWSWS